MNKKLIAAILKNAPKDSDGQPMPEDGFSTYLADELTRIEGLKKLRSRLDLQVQKEQERHYSELAIIAKNRTQMQAQCRHYDSTYYPDASGNNDSETICNICGASL